MNANATQPAPHPRRSRRPSKLDLQTIFSWLLADGIVEKDKVKAHFAQAQGILKNAVGSMHPLTAVAQCKLVSAPAAAPPADARRADRMVRGQGRPALHPHRSAEDRLHQGGGRDVGQLCGALQHPAGRTHARHADGGHRRPVRHEWEARSPRSRAAASNWCWPTRSTSRNTFRSSSAWPSRSATPTSRTARTSRCATTSSSWSNWASRTSSSTPTTSTSSTSSTGCGSYAFEQRASDIHLEPKREIAVIRFRIDGVLHQVYQVPAVVMIAMTARIKLLGRMDVIEKRRPQDGRIKTRTTGGQEVELRLSTMPTAFGEKLVMRIFDPEVVVKTCRNWAFPPDDAAALGRADQAPARHHPGHRTDRLGQDHDAVHDAQGAGDQRGERLHGGRPDRDGRSLVQPDAGAAGHRPVLRRRRARPDAAGSRTSSWSARSATWPRPRWRSRPR
jgi:general secretion pathway protein E